MRWPETDVHTLRDSLSIEKLRWPETDVHTLRDSLSIEK